MTARRSSGYRQVVFDTAEFMASFPAWDAERGRFVLGPPLNCAQETYPEGPHDQLHASS
ncbi:MAG: hypothetical protein MZW92_42400 [Comamonadaceae bacterium]|nr:hypothetical protein [Comamonadaceae bacterium]